MSEQEVWDKLNRLREEADYQDYVGGKRNYEWELGTKIMNMTTSYDTL